MPTASDDPPDREYRSTGGPTLDPEGGLTVGPGSLGLFNGAAIWSIPAAVVSVPGVLVVLWVMLQAVGALAWLPAVRRLRGENRDERRQHPA